MLFRNVVRNFLIATSALVVAVGVAACGSDSDQAEPTAGPGVSTSAQASTESTTANTPPPPAVPTPAPELLQDSLAKLVDPSIPAADKVPLIVDGPVHVQGLETMAAGLENYGRVTFAVSDVVVQGTSAIAKVDVTSPHGTVPIHMTWDNVDGAWKLNHDSTCNLRALGRAPC